MSEDDFTLADAADELAAGVRSFLQTLPFAAPESIGLHASVKLREKLEEYERIKRESSG